MNALKLIVAIACATLLSACESPAPIPNESPPQAQAQPSVTPPKSSLATIYVLRSNASPTKANIQIGVDGKTITSLPDNRYTQFQVPPGVRILSAGYPSTPDMTARLTMILSAGQTYILRYSSGDHGPSLLGKSTEPMPPGGDSQWPILGSHRTFEG